MHTPVRTLGVLVLGLLTVGLSGCKDKTARAMAREVADSLVTYSQRVGVWATHARNGICNLEMSLLMELEHDPDDPNDNEPALHDSVTPLSNVGSCPEVGPDPADPPPPVTDPWPDTGGTT